MLVTELGIVIVDKPTQLLNAPLPIVVNELDSVTDPKLEQP